jgi:hypothetical protein
MQYYVFTDMCCPVVCNVVSLPLWCGNVMGLKRAAD